MDPVAHSAIALAASKLIGPEAPPWVLGLATQMPDLLSFGLLASGVERKAETKLDFRHGLRYITEPCVPWSHGLSMSVVWSFAAGALAYPILRDLCRLCEKSKRVA